jgi:hypothetical protein
MTRSRPGGCSPQYPLSSPLDAVRRVLAMCHQAESGCWVWGGAVNSKGYGYIKVDGRTIGVHRVMYAATRGPILRGIHIHHICSNTLCVCPGHLAAVTPDENRAEQADRLSGIREYRTIAAEARERWPLPDHPNDGIPI